MNEKIIAPHMDEFDVHETVARQVIVEDGVPLRIKESEC